MSRTVHVIGAGLAGLAAAVRLAGRGERVVVHEATSVAGGRCRSYHDHATGLRIDNGNHLLLSGNRDALSYLDAIGGREHLSMTSEAAFPFCDYASGERWTVRIGDGLPWWVFNASRRVPGTGPRDYLKLARLLWTGPQEPLASVIACHGPLYDRLLRPLFLAALNVDPAEGSARLAGAVVRESVARGGAACRPLFAPQGLGAALVEPATAYLASRGGALRFLHEAQGIAFRGEYVSELRFSDGAVAVRPDDAVVLAVPPYIATTLVPGLKGPTDFRAIVNLHFRTDPPPDFPPMLGVVNATTEWIFSFPQRLSVTISNADALLGRSREDLARVVWREVAATAGLASELPPWQIVRERRATFAATPAEDAKRPPTRTRWGNLVLAGDWTATGLPATLEGAIRSGHRAADALLSR